MDKLVLIDGNSLLNRAFYAMPVFSTTLGQPTNAIYGFIKLLLKIFSDEKPQYTVVTFDLKEPTFRHKMYEGYKATRSPMPEELASQVKPLKDLLSAMKVAICEKAGLEADDLIGTLSNKFNVHSYIYTGDRDAFQLVDEKTDIYYTKRGVSDLLKLSVNNFEAEIGLKPSSIIDLKALMGDKSDNIPGVAGIGETTARKLIAQFGDLQTIYDNVDEISSASIRNKLNEGKESAQLSYKLATIDRNCNLEIKLSECETPAKYGEEVRELLETFEFKSLIPLFNFDVQTAENSEREIKYPQLIEIKNRADFEVICKKTGKFYINFVNNGAEIFYDDKCYSVKYEQDDLLCAFSKFDFLDCIKSITGNINNFIVVYDFKAYLHDAYDVIGMPVCDVDDVSLLHYLADYFDESKDLKALCDAKNYDYQFSGYALRLLYDEYMQILNRDGTFSLYSDIEKPLIKVLFDMEHTGVKIDLKQLKLLGDIYLDKINKLRDEIFELCGCYFNLNSPGQLGEVLFEKLGLKSGKKNKSGKYSTSAEILETLADESEVVRKILSFRLYQKLYSTYVEGFKPIIDNKSQLVHTTYNQTVTTTGRLSSTNPNLQNIPIREEEGREIRKFFIPRNGNVFIDADYSQIELRLLAHFSGCKELVEAYEQDRDIHAVTASQVFGVDINEVTPKMRREAKAVNFGIIYGISEFGLSKNLGIEVKTAREYIQKYFKTYSAVKDYMEKNVEFAKKNGYVATLTGRKRYIKEINSSNYNLRQFGERAAMNMPLQGSSADIIKIAMLNISRELSQKNMKSKLILQVHDELVIDAPIEEMELATQILKSGMENAVKLNVPLKVDVHCGKNWYEAK